MQTRLCDHLFSVINSFICFCSVAWAGCELGSVWRFKQSLSWLTWPLALSVERLSLETSRAERRLGLRRRDDRRRSQAAALRPRALQVLLSVPLQTLQPQDTHEKVFTPANYIFTAQMTLPQIGDLIILMLQSHEAEELSGKEVKTLMKADAD